MAFEPFEYDYTGVKSVEPEFRFKDYQKPTGQEEQMKNLRQAGRFNVVSQALQSLTEGIGLGMGAPIERRKDEFGVSALDKFLAAQTRNDQLQAEYDKLDLNKDITEKKMKLDADLQNARLAAQTIFERERQKGQDWRTEQTNKSAENRAAIQQKGYLDREKVQQEGLNWRKQKELEAEAAGTLPDEEAAALWEQYPELRGQFKQWDSTAGEWVQKPFGDLNKDERKNLDSYGKYISNPWNQKIDYEPGPDGVKATNRATGKNVDIVRSYSDFPDGSIDESRSQIFYTYPTDENGEKSQKEWKTFVDTRTGVRYAADKDKNLIVLTGEGKALKIK